MTRRKILVISHNPFCDSDNMGITLTNIFKNFNKNELCQLYFKDQIPDFTLCSNYFYINEIAVLKKLFLPKYETGNILNEDDRVKSITIDNLQSNNKLHDIINNIGRSKTQFTYLFRNFIWNRNKWFSDELKKWLKQQNPTCIFFAAGDYTFSMNIAIKISEFLNIPLFTYYVDEYFLYKRESQLIPLEAKLYRNKFRELVKKSSMGFCISEMMKNEYERLFNKKFDLLCNACEFSNETIQENNNNVLKMYYFGNINFNRWKGLSDLSSAIEELNKENDIKINFEIYSGEQDTNLIKQLISNKSVNFKGSITQIEVKKRIKQSDILLHTESFDEETKKQVKYSVSTKIPSLLASNKIIIAYGPIDVESINYLKRNKVAIVINSKDELKKKLMMIYNHYDLSKMKVNAKNLLELNHSSILNRNKLYHYFDNCIGEKNEKDIRN